MFHISLFHCLHPQFDPTSPPCYDEAIPENRHLRRRRRRIILSDTCAIILSPTIPQGPHADTLSLRNRALSIRSNKSNKNSNSARSPTTSAPRHGFSLSSLRGHTQPELSKRLYKLIKSENHLIQNYEAAGKERVSIASQLSDWGEATNDDAVSDISDKVGVLLSEIGEQEDLYAHNLDDSRAVLKAIRNTEKSVQPSRDNKAKIADEIAKLKAKEPESTRLVTLEQELVRAEAENLVAEAQLTNVVSPPLA